jgi:hypothetical protein
MESINANANENTGFLVPGFKPKPVKKLAIKTSINKTAMINVGMVAIRPASRVTVIFLKLIKTGTNCSARDLLF